MTSQSSSTRALQPTPPPPPPPQQQLEHEQQPPPPPPQRQPQQEQPLPSAYIFTFEQMQRERPVKDMGPAAAAWKQQELRKECFVQNIMTIDITSTWPEWRACLRALSEKLQQEIIGNGIVSITFRLLENVMDTNYFKRDSGERHVFEIIRRDASRVHLHFHTNGTMDKPVLIPPTITPANANGGASQPTLIYMPDTPSQPLIGRKECTLALTTILDACWYETAGAADITDGLAFDWKRYVAHIRDNHEITAMQPEKVFALRIKADELPRLAFCAGDTTWKTLQPQDAHYRDGSELTQTHGENKQANRA